MKLKKNINGAWLTDIDDTLLLSGEYPDDQWINNLADFIRILKSQNIIWVPMSGVALVKLGNRILDRMPEDVCDNIFYYGGDGSQKYYWDSDKKSWKSDEGFSRLFSDAQALMVLGEKEFRDSLNQINNRSGGDVQSTEVRINESFRILAEHGFEGEVSILDLLKEELVKNDLDPDDSETYFRGGSVSWMMLGDISAEPYHQENNHLLRMTLVEFSRKWLLERNSLKHLGAAGIGIPFPGARGIKFVLQGNDKERATRDLLEWSGLKPEQVLFAGNELFAGGNDNMIRNISGVTLLSVGEKEDPGENIVSGFLTDTGSRLIGIEANTEWIKKFKSGINSGRSWNDFLVGMKSGAAN